MTFDPKNTARYEQMIAELEQTGMFRVVREFTPQSGYKVHPGSGGERLGVAMIIDTETTGRDHKLDRVFEIGYVMTEYGKNTGSLYQVIGEYSGFEDPGYPLPEKIEQLTKVKYEEVRGKSFDDERIRSDLARADIVIAQNASFDRKFLEGIFPEFQAKPWACSVEDAPWDDMGITTRKQEYLAYAVAGVKYSAHRALTDAQVLLHILSHPSHDGRSIFSHVLESARKPSYRVWAMHSPYEKKDVLKDIDRGYRWSSGEDEDKIGKVWFKERVEDLDEELRFLGHEIYHPSKGLVTVDLMTARTRYSFADRFEERKTGIECPTLEIEPACSSLPKSDEWEAPGKSATTETGRRASSGKAAALTLNDDPMSSVDTVVASGAEGAPARRKRTRSPG
jgi:DNA polymerase-3 subunit epsilon